MRRILLVLADREIATSTIEFGYQIAKLTGSGLTALFLRTREQEISNSEPGTNLFNETGIKNASTLTRNRKKIEGGVDFFFEACARRGVNGDVLIRGKGGNRILSPVDEVIEESRFADLIIIDPEISFEIKDGRLSSRFIKDIATAAECPVVVAPTSFEGLEQIVFCYDGSRSSVAAIKQFTYLLPELSKNKLTVLEVAGHQTDVEKKDKLASWLKIHYPDFEFQLLHGNPTSELLKYFLSKDNVFVILGSYGRTMVSQFFKPSSADLLIHVVNLPLFITHH